MSTNDTPGMGLTTLGKQRNVIAYSASFGWSFVDYLMYEPPNSTKYVALATFTWSTNGTATIPTTNKWTDFAKQHGGSDVAGTVDAPKPFVGVFASGQAVYPKWTLIEVPVDY